MVVSQRRFRQFTLRAMLLTVTLVGIVLGLAMFKCHQIRLRSHQIAELSKSGHEVAIGPPLFGGRLSWLIGTNSGQVYSINTIRNGTLASEKDIESICGLGDVSDLMTSGPNFDDDALRRIAAFPSLKNLSLGNTSVSTLGWVHIGEITPLTNLSISNNLNRHDDFEQSADAMVAAIVKLENLTHLYLTDNGIDDRAVKRVVKLDSLCVLYINSELVTDEGVRSLEDTFKLEEFGTDSTQISDGGLAALSRLRDLKRLYVSGPRISAKAKRQFVLGRPDVKGSTERWKSADTQSGSNAELDFDRVQLTIDEFLRDSEDITTDSGVRVTWDSESRSISIRGTDESDAIFIRDENYAGSVYPVVWANARGKGKAVCHGADYGIEASTVSHLRCHMGDGRDLVNLIYFNRRTLENWNDLRNTRRPVDVDTGLGEDLIVVGETLARASRGDADDTVVVLPESE